ncbi:MAG: DNA repair protein RecN [Actinobacteria bacterium]|nr:DNA repair protein RecN [Actinomycetota bacterium]
MSKDGKSRANIGGASSTAAALAEIGTQLIAIHGQHASLSLSKAAKQRELLDSFGGDRVTKELELFRGHLATYKSLMVRIADLKRAMESRDKELSELQELAREFAKLRPEPNEIADLSATIARLSSIEDLRAAATGALQSLDHEESGAISALSSTRKFLASAKGKDRELDGLADEIQEAFYTLSDATSSINRYLESLDADPSALENAQQRKAALTNFAKKFGEGDLNSGIERARQASSRMADLQGGEEVIVELEEQATAEFARLTSASKKLSSARMEAATELSAAITSELSSLSMPNGRFQIEFTQSELSRDGEIREYGVDQIEMVFSSHGQNLLPISKAASGGELSRLLLAIEVTIAGREERGCYVFDEVDAGIGGKAALEVGKRLRALAEKAQVIVVTHLPQVAIWADRHLVVEKSENGSITTSSIAIVDGPEREMEIARMLSGLEDSEHAQEHARELLQLRKDHFR